MQSRTILGAAAFAAALLAGCTEPGTFTSLDTRAMGAGGRMNCGMRPDELLQRVNAARAVGRQCGDRHMAAAAPLKWDPALYSAASRHSVDMARRNYLEHRSPEGFGVRDRLAVTHYKWKSVGENLSGGSRDAGEAVEGWLASADHCENLMDPGFVEMGGACVQQPGTEWGTYWTMVLGRR